MKYKFILLYFSIIIAGCSSFDKITKKISIENTKIQKNIAYSEYENYKAKGIVKFETKKQKISSRFIFKKSKTAEEIEFLNIFNNPLISFEIKKNEIIVKKSKKDVNSEAIQEVLNREVFKKIILNFSNILTGKIKNAMQYEKYENGLYKSIRNENYAVFYKMYNDKFLPVMMRVDFFSISFDLKIINWDTTE